MTSRFPWKRMSELWLALVGLTVLAACGPSVESIHVSPTQMHLTKVGATLSIEAEARDRLGAKLSDAVLTFTSRTPQVAQVSAAGLVTAQQDGTTTVVVQAEGTDVMEFVHVTVRLPEALEVIPREVTCHIAGEKVIKAQVLDRREKAFENVTLEWSSSDTKIVRVKNGKLLGIDEGEATITVKAMGLEATTKVTVTWAPGQKALIEQQERVKARAKRRGGRGGGGQPRGNRDPRLQLFD